MKTIRTSVDIDASLSTVWTILTDLRVYDEWNSQTTSASGTVAIDETVNLHVERTGSRAVDIRATVTRVDPESTLEWVARLPIPHLFTARHTFELEPLDDGRTRFVNHEQLSGLLVPFIVSDDAQQDYEAMNWALAERAEQHIAVSSDLMA